MEISSIRSEMYQNIQTAQEKEVPADKNADSTQKSSSASPSKDEYIKGGEDSEESAGIYKPSQDEDGNRKILYDKPDNEDNKKAEQEKCTANTDKVDREIEKLKQEQQQLQQQIQSAADGGTEELKRKLTAVERELQQKDNDTYRRQHTVFTNS